MNRVVKHLYGKLYMGPFLVPHYYVQFQGSDQYEFVRCSDVNVSNAQKIAFDTHFGEDEAAQQQGGIAVKEATRSETGSAERKQTLKLCKAKPLASLNFIQDGDLQSDDSEKYESSFVKDSTPTVYSSSDCERDAVKADLKKRPKKRKRAFLESDDELSSESSTRKPTTSTPRKRTSLKHDVKIKPNAGGAASRKRSTASSKFTPLIILGANSNAAEMHVNASSPEVIILE